MLSSLHERRMRNADPSARYMLQMYMILTEQRHMTSDSAQSQPMPSSPRWSLCCPAHLILFHFLTSRIWGKPPAEAHGAEPIEVPDSRALFIIEALVQTIGHPSLAC